MKNSLRVILATLLMFTVFSCAEEVMPTTPVELDTEIILVDLDNEESDTKDGDLDGGEEIDR